MFFITFIAFHIVKTTPLDYFINFILRNSHATKKPANKSLFDWGLTSSRLIYTIDIAL